MSDIRNFYKVASNKVSDSKGKSMNQSPAKAEPPNMSRYERSQKRTPSQSKRHDDQKENKSKKDQNRAKTPTKTPQKTKRNDEDEEMKDEEVKRKPLVDKEEEDDDVVTRRRSRPQQVIESDSEDEAARSKARQNKKRSIQQLNESESKQGKDSARKSMVPATKRKPQDEMESKAQPNSQNTKKAKEETSKKQKEVQSIDPQDYFENAAYSGKKNRLATGVSPQMNKMTIDDDRESRGSRQIPSMQAQSSKSPKPNKSSSQHPDSQSSLRSRKSDNTGAADKGKTKQAPPTPIKDVDEAMEVDDCLNELTIVLSGEFESISRSKLEEFIKDHGGRVTSAVSGKTNYLIVGYKLEDGREVTQGSKYQKATTLGTPILTETEFEELIRKRTGNPDFTLSIRKGLIEDFKQSEL